VFVTIQKIRPATEANATYNGFEKAVLVIEAMEYAIFIFLLRLFFHVLDIKSIRIVDSLSSTMS
jgi:hypothetical protein